MNLIILQVVLYLIIGNIMGSHLELGQLIIMYVIMLGVQVITHIKAVADGILYNQLMNENDKFRNFVKNIRKSKKDKD